MYAQVPQLLGRVPSAAASQALQGVRWPRATAVCTLEFAWEQGLLITGHEGGEVSSRAWLVLGLLWLINPKHHQRMQLGAVSRREERCTMSSMGGGGARVIWPGRGVACPTTKFVQLTPTVLCIQGICRPDSHRCC